MTYNDINNILKSFAKSNMVFSNEYDFQFELVQALQKLPCVKDVKMEVLSLETDWLTVDENKKLIFSFLIDNDYVLKQKLLLNQPIFEIVLNEKRMEYMKDHREIFFKKEQERKRMSV